MPYKVLTKNAISVKGLDRLPRPEYEVASEFTAPDAILLRSYKLQEDDIASSVLAIGRAGAGTNNIPVDICSRRGIPVFNSPGANANAVKELVATALLLGSRGIIAGVNWVDTLTDHQDKAALNALLEAEKKRFKGTEVAGKTLGVVGLGAIGSLVADMALQLGMRVIGYDPALSVEAAWRLSSQVEKADALASLFARSDFITLHLPVLDSTRDLVNDELLSNCKQGATLLNFARQEIVHEPALIKALDAGRVKAYIADFPTPGLIGRDDVILMPHIGASTAEAEDNCAVMAADQIKDFLENGNIKNSVNFPSVYLERTPGCRIAVTNINVPKILGSVLAVLADADINVADMLNKSRGELAYNLIDMETCPSDDTLGVLLALEGVINVRLVGPTD